MMTGSPWRRRLPRVRVAGEHRGHATGLPVVLVCSRCRYVAGAYLTTNWTWRPGTGWLCPSCAGRQTLRYRLVTHFWDALGFLDTVWGGMTGRRNG